MAEGLGRGDGDGGVRRTRRAAVAVISLGAGLAALLAWTIWRSPARVRLLVEGVPPYNDPSLFTVQIDDGDGVRRIPGREISYAALAHRDERPYATRTRGTLFVRVAMVAGTDTLAVADLRLPLRRDWEWNVHFTAGGTDPRQPPILRMGFPGLQTVLIRPRAPGARPDTLWVQWGGDSISDPDTYY